MISNEKDCSTTVKKIRNFEDEESGREGGNEGMERAEKSETSKRQPVSEESGDGIIFTPTSFAGRHR